MSSKESKKASKHDLDIKKPVVDSTPEPKSAKSKGSRGSKVVSSGGIAPPVDHFALVDKKLHDLTLLAEGGSLGAHKAILQARCKPLLDGATAKKNKKGTTEYELKDVHFTTLKVIVQWLYSDRIDVASIQLADLIKVIKAAHHYDLARLAQTCEHHLQSQLTYDNIIPLMSQSHTLEAQTALTICLDFAATVQDEMASNPALLQKLDKDILILMQSHCWKLKKQLSEGWTPPAIEITAPSTIVENFKELYSTMNGHDLTVTVGKAPVKCHRALIGHASPKLMEIIPTDPKESTVPLPKEFKSVSVDTFNDLLKFIYYSSIDIDTMAATQLISFAKQLGLSNLVDICVEKIRSGMEIGTCLSIMEVAYNPLLKEHEDLQKELKAGCRSFFIDHVQEIDVSVLKNMDSAIGADLLSSIQKQIGVRWTVNENAIKRKSSSSVHLDASEHTGKEESDSKDNAAATTADTSSAPATGGNAATAGNASAEDEKSGEEAPKSAKDTETASSAAPVDNKAALPRQESKKDRIAPTDEPTPRKDEKKSNKEKSKDKKKVEEEAAPEPEPETPKEGKKDKKKEKSK